MRKLLALAAFLILPGWAFAQGVRVDNPGGPAQKIVQGFVSPIPGATITVCTSSATGAPCTPLVPTSPVTLCTDSTCSTAAPNPFTADAGGNYGFWAVPGTYKVSITAPGVTGSLLTVTLPCAAGVSCVANGGPASLTNLTVSGTGTFANINKIIYASGGSTPMKCDGVTDDTAALAAAITAGGLNAHIILPSGTCLVSVESNGIFLYDGTWISGAGKMATTIKRKNGGVAGNAIFLVAPGGGFGSTGNVLFTDFTIDGNQANQSGGSDNIDGGVVSKLSVLRMRLINAWNNGLALFPNGPGNFASDLLIADNDFEGNGVRAGCTVVSCSDMLIKQPLRVRVENNRSDSSLNFVLSSSQVGAGQFNISGNIVNNCAGFAVAVGGGTIGAANASITGNTFNCPNSTQNIVDLAYWNDMVVNNNTIVMGLLAGISDLPPALHVVVTGNRIIGNPAGPITVSCIGLGGSDLTITDNVCNNAGGAGIIVGVASTGPSRGAVIANNVTWDNSRASSGSHEGIEVFLATGGTAAISNVIIKGNIAYDDQGVSQTQGYGIGLAVSGQTTGFSNITIEGNDVRGNKTGGILNSTSGASGMSIHDNQGAEGAYLCQLAACQAITLKKGSGAGNYTNATTAYTVADATNLCYTVTIPTGWKLGVSMSGQLGTATAAVVASFALTDNAACSTANAGILVEGTVTGTAAAVLQPIALNWVITGDGAAHNIALQFKTSNGADSATLQNSSATLTPTMKFELMPSN